jgi:alpha-methylacyl-CoA racemase
VTPAELGGPAPGLGEHTDEVLAELGLADRIAQLRIAGVVA